ncbi:protein NEOXANTHIN-DEFICIENT 1-like [Cynara cardunculus var. scolymus]|uniref:protein NEOXANTHIN-DEFICIENT 1-like n=1 Tax=Cynara cardunculus var. scolymus TaxID=59895 RepID=UPI000D629514|nr:protein NEOXANTHIN-DEFICIENT 1-like [Cynara cardunculus var. scolymus]
MQAWKKGVWRSSLIVDHPFQEFGLPSQVATFSKSTPRRRSNADVGNMDIRFAEINGPVAIGLYDIPVLKMNPLKWMGMGMGITMSLPSFSGHTEHKPQLLKYSCQIECRVKPTSPARVLWLLDRKHSSESQNEESSTKRDVGTAVMLSKPILALEFNCLKMQVEPPVVVSGKHG